MYLTKFLTSFVIVATTALLILFVVLRDDDAETLVIEDIADIDPALDAIEYQTTNQELPCNDTGTVVAEYKELVSARTLIAEEHFRTLGKENTDWETIDYQADMVSLEPQSAHLIVLSAIDFEHRTLAENNLQGFNAITEAEKKQLDSILYTNDVSQVSSLPDGLGKKLFDSLPLFSYVLLRGPEVSNELIQRLLSKDYAVYQIDIISAISTDVDQATIQQMIQANRDTEPEVFVYGTEVTTVGLTAIRKNDPDILQQWLTHIPTSGFEEIGITELDLQPVPAIHEIETATQVVSSLLEAGRVYKTIAGYRKLKSWAPEEWMVENASVISRPVHGYEADYADQLDRLKTLLSENTIKVGALKDVLIKCNVKVDQEADKQLSGAPISLAAQMEKVVANNRNKLDGLIADQVADLMGSGESQSGEKLAKAYIDNDWEILFEFVDEVKGTENEKVIVDLLMHRAITSGSAEQLGRLFEYGARLPEDAILSLIKAGNFEIFDTLVTYGADYTYTDPMGMNTLGAIARFSDGSKEAKALFDRLVDMKMPTATNEELLDPLYYAISSITKNDSAHFINKLLDSGATIRPIHTSALERLRKENFDHYLELMQDAPGLFEVALKNEL